MAIKLDRKQKINFRLLSAMNVLVFAIVCLSIQAAWAGFDDDFGAFKNKIGAPIKAAAVSGLKHLSPTRAQKLESTNITQNVFNAPANIANSLKTTAGSFVGAFAGPEAGKTVAEGKWSNALTTTSGAMTAGKVISSTIIGISYGALAGPAVGKAAGTTVYNTNLGKLPSGIYEKSISPQINALSQDLEVLKKLALIAGPVTGIGMNSNDEGSWAYISTTRGWASYIKPKEGHIYIDIQPREEGVYWGYLGGNELPSMKPTSGYKVNDKVNRNLKTDLNGL